jgi:hypothetical protein
MKLPTLTGAGLSAAKYVLLAAAGAFALWFFFIRPDAALRRAATAEADAIVAETQGEAAEDTIRIVVDHNNEVATITTRIEETNAEILSAPGADQAVDPAGYDAFVRALCLQDGRREPVCADVLQRDGDGVGPD